MATFFSRTQTAVKPEPTNQPVAIANWDYSWILRSQGHDEDEYHLLPRRMDELVERGFNALRIDAWPHLVAPARDGSVQKAFDILPREVGAKRRGSEQRRRIHPQEKLLRIAQAAKERDVQLWLTSWLLPDTLSRRSEVRSPEDFVRIWHYTLEFLHQSGALEAVKAIDLAHQFPSLPSGYGAWNQLFRRAPHWSGRKWRARGPADMARLSSFLVASAQRIKTLYPHIEVGLSMSANLAMQTRGLDFSEFDFADLHLPVLQSGWSLGRKGREDMERQLSAHQVFCQMQKITPVLSATSASLPAKVTLPDVCRLTERGVEKALESGLRVINPSHQAKPQFDLWNEVTWLQHINRLIRNR